MSVQDLALQRDKYRHLTDEEWRWFLQQVEGRERTADKLPTFAQIEDWWYPVRLSCEQCSSELAARYKASLVESQKVPSGTPINVESCMVDLTGGYGVDTYFLSERFAHTDYVEQNEELCKIAEHNFNVRSDNVQCTKVSVQHNFNVQSDNVRCTFNVQSDNVRCTKVSIHNSTAEEFLKTAGQYDLIFLDPARRDSHGGKVFRLEDCTPNVVELLPTLLRHGKQVMLKLSPMLDLTQAINKLQSDNVQCTKVSVHNTSAEEFLKTAGDNVQSDKGTKYQELQSDKGTKYQVTKWDVHVVAIKNEVKEVLVVSRLSLEDRPQTITCIDLVEPEKAFVFTKEQENNCPLAINPSPLAFIYEPSAAILKAGAYKLVGARYGLQKLDVNTHLYCSERLVTDFPGRKWKIEQVVRDRKDLPAELKQANVLTRNYPMTPEQLKKKLHLRDGGTAYLIGARIQGKPTVLRATLIP